MVSCSNWLTIGVLPVWVSLWLPSRSIGPACNCYHQQSSLLLKTQRKSHNFFLRKNCCKSKKIRSLASSESASDRVSWLKVLVLIHHHTDAGKSGESDKIPSDDIVNIGQEAVVASDRLWLPHCAQQEWGLTTLQCTVSFLHCLFDFSPLCTIATRPNSTVVHESDDSLPVNDQQVKGPTACQD